MVNPVEEERRKQKQARRLKLKNERQQQRLEKLSKRNPQNLEQQIIELEARKSQNQGKLSAREQFLLETYCKERDQIKWARRKLNVPPDARTQEIATGPQPGSETKSIYYDEELNPSGQAPDGLPYAETWQFQWYRDLRQVPPDILAIPLPRDPPPPCDILHTETKTVYESAPVVRDFVREAAEMIPSSVLKHKKQRTEARNK